jgi:hypothetical protein
MTASQDDAGYSHLAKDLLHENIISGSVATVANED